MEELANLEAERGNPEYLPTVPAHRDRSTTKGHNAIKDRNVIRKRGASKEMCDFLILNISSLQLIPVNMIVYRQQYGSVNPTVVIAPAIVATFFSTLVAVIFCKMMNRKQRV